MHIHEGVDKREWSYSHHLLPSYIHLEWGGEGEEEGEGEGRRMWVRRGKAEGEGEEDA